MKGKRHIHPFLAILTTLPSLTFIFIIAVISVTACNVPFIPSNNVQEFSDKNARMYQMYFDSSGDPALNELQIRRFMGHLHMADIAAIFGDIQSLPLDDTCNYAAGPVEHDGATWFLATTPDLVGVNLVSLTPDGTRSSAFDLDGDRVVDILDMRLFDNRRISIFTEELGMDVFRNYLEGLDPFCNPELIQQLGLPELGCDETADGSSGGGGSFAGSGIMDPIEMMCSEYDTGPWTELIGPATRSDPPDSVILPGPGDFYTTTILESQERYRGADGHEYLRTVNTYVTTDDFDGSMTQTTKIITDVNISTNPPHVAQVTEETVTSDGYGSRTTQKYNADGTPDGPAVTQPFLVKEEDVGQGDYHQDESNPPPERGGGAQTTGGGQTNGGSQTNPGPEGADIAFAEFCRNRANHRSGIEQAVSQDPASINLSCGDLVGAPSGNCNIIEWARPADFNGVLEPPSSDDGCDAFSDAQGRCEGASVEDRIRRFLGHGADLWSLDLPAISICPPLLCDPALAVEVQSYTAGGIDIACPVAADAPAPSLEPSEENCPPGTYYAPVTNRCIAIDVPQGGGSDGGGGSCTLSASACSAEGLSFDSTKCECVPLE